MYALFEDGRQISKSHSTKEAALVEAFERKLVIIGYNDFLGEKGPYQHAPTLCKGVEIREVEHETIYRSTQVRHYEANNKRRGNEPEDHARTLSFSRGTGRMDAPIPPQRHCWPQSDNASTHGREIEIMREEQTENNKSVDATENGPSMAVAPAIVVIVLLSIGVLICTLI